MAKRGGYNMGMMPGNMNNLMKQAQRMQKQMETTTKELEDKIYESSVGGGVVTAKVSGKKELMEIKLDPEVVDPDDIEMLEDLIIAATNEALRKVEEESTAVMSKLTGGLGGLGRKVAERMVERGAKALVLLSRSGAASEDAKAFVRRIEDTGVKVVTPALDITSGESSAFFKVMDEVLAGLPPVMGVVHAAGVLADAAFVNLTAEACEKVWCPKVTGAVRLADYLMLRSIMPNFFVMFSSATVLLGNPGQANYVAANMALESLAGNLRAFTPTK